jgi:hypothetical protein
MPEKRGESGTKRVSIPPIRLRRKKHPRLDNEVPTPSVFDIMKS